MGLVLAVWKEDGHPGGGGPGLRRHERCSAGSEWIPADRGGAVRARVALAQGTGCSCQGSGVAGSPREVVLLEEADL